MQELKKITSLKELLAYLPTCSGTDYVKVARQLAIPLSDYAPYMHWSEDCYTRNCIVRTDKYELILLCWEAGQETPVHCHGGEECWVKVLEGAVQEFRHFKDKDGNVIQEHDMTMEPGKMSYMNDEMGFHSLHNIADGRSVTLHLYMNPITHCTAWDASAQTFVPRELNDYSYAGEIVELV